MTYRDTGTIRTSIRNLDLVYSVFFDFKETMHHQEVIANDHLDAVKIIENQYEKSEVRLVFKGHVPDPIWIG